MTLRKRDYFENAAKTELSGKIKSRRQIPHQRELKLPKSLMIMMMMRPLRYKLIADETTFAKGASLRLGITMFGYLLGMHISTHLISKRIQSWTVQNLEYNFRVAGQEDLHDIDL